MTIAITDVVLRDAHQSLFATRLRLDDMLPIAAALDDVGYGSLECWGGATFDACIRFLGEDPWLRLRLVADKFLQPQTLGILLLGVIAFGIGTAAGVLMAKLLNLCSKNKINPLIGSAGVSAVPMAARVSNKVGLESDPQNFLLMHAMGPNVAGVIGSAIAAGVMLKYVLAM
nr:sodium ion-translocating decarboxylase subunit beta [Salmonella enterica]